MIYYLEPFAEMPSKQPSLNKRFFGELDENLQNRIIFSSYLKKSDLICPGRTVGKLRGKTTFMKYYYYLCELCGITPLEVIELREQMLLEKISLKYPDVLKLLIETKLKELELPIDGGITCDDLPASYFSV